MKLTTEQINQLYTFTRQHYVEWYDLQTELVDHLANAIEEQWQENPKLSFNEALQNEFKKFGVFGFMDVVEGKQRFLQKKYNQIVWSIVKTFFYATQNYGNDWSYRGIVFVTKIKSLQWRLGVAFLWVIGSFCFLWNDFKSVETQKTNSESRKTLVV